MVLVYHSANGNVGGTGIVSVTPIVQQVADEYGWEGSPHFLAMDRSILLVDNAKLTVLAALWFHSRIPFSLSLHSQMASCRTNVRFEKRNGRQHTKNSRHYLRTYK